MCLRWAGQNRTRRAGSLTLVTLQRATVRSLINKIPRLKVGDAAMATGDSGDTLESWLNKATDPSNQEDRWDCIQSFYELVNQETEGPQVATRLLAHKIQSPQEREALQALTVLEACMNNCGKSFHSEAVKFRFLNELIKVLSPKYLGVWSPQKVKSRVTEVLYSWTLWLKDESKVQEAYGMLKKQGLVKKDPKLPDTIVMPPPTQRTGDSVFDQEDKAKLLARLLKSTRPEDLQTANRLIKNIIQEEQEKAEKVSKRVSTLEEVESSTRQLRELLDQFSPTGVPLQHSHELKVLYERCDRLRPSLFRLASDTMDDDSALAQILAANDKLTLVANTFRDRVGRREVDGGGGGGGGVRNGAANGEGCKNDVPTSPREIKSYHLIDLSALDSPQMVCRANSPPALLSFDSLSLSSSLTPPPPRSRLDSNLLSLEFTELGLDNLLSEPRQSPEKPRTYYEELLQLSGGGLTKEAGPCGETDCVLRARGCVSNGTDTRSSPQCKPVGGSESPSNSHSQPMRVSGPPESSEENVCVPRWLRDVYVPLETIKPSRLEPITVFDQGGVHASLHFAKDTPPGQPSVAVVVISTVNTSALLVKDFLFQAAVPKTMSVKLQPSSGQLLPPYSPLLPPAALSQVLLLSNPHRRKVRLRYKLTLLHGDQPVSETGEVDTFPEWGSLVDRL